MSRASVTCPYRTVTATAGRATCALGLYGGKPYLGNCIACIAAGDNSPAAVAELHARAAITHPPAAAPIAGCCDTTEP